MIQLVRESLMIHRLWLPDDCCSYEYLNVLTSGHWGQWLRRGRHSPVPRGRGSGRHPWLPGRVHRRDSLLPRVMSFGSEVAAMIAASGDEAFVMLDSHPQDCPCTHGRSVRGCRM